jgi:hypothetical protein
LGGRVWEIMLEAMAGVMDVHSPVGDLFGVKRREAFCRGALPCLPNPQSMKIRIIIYVESTVSKPRFTIPASSCHV